MYLIIECKINFVNRGNSMEKRTIRTGNIEITYILTRKKVKNINMKEVYFALTAFLLWLSL